MLTTMIYCWVSTIVARLYSLDLNVFSRFQSGLEYAHMAQIHCAGSQSFSMCLRRRYGAGSQ
ncbi:protein of unknown function [Nitratireductor aquimarinus]